MAKLIFRTTLNSTLTRLKKILRTLLLILHLLLDSTAVFRTPFDSFLAFSFVCLVL